MFASFLRCLKHRNNIFYYNRRARDTPNSFDFPADFKVSRSSQQRTRQRDNNLGDAAFGKENLQAEPTSQRSEVCGRSICHQRDERSL